jgi:formylmethanofuran dehydrogenase subunit A
MSWYVDVAAKSKESIAKRLEKEQHIPADLKAVMLAHVNAMVTPAPQSLILLRTTGHLGPEGGNAEFKLSSVPVLE